ncbi:MAG: dimethylsulfonioproprionate lyase family protein [Candidatus Puniceispirillaceae bacterium]
MAGEGAIPSVKGPALQNRLADAFDVTVRPTAGEAPLVETLANDLRAVVTTPQELPVDQQPPMVSDRLTALLDAMPVSPLAEVLRPLARDLDWYQIFDSSHTDPSLAGGLMAGQVIGGRGKLHSKDLYLGLFLLAPHVTYPLHQHAALEIYHVLSGEIYIRHGREKLSMHVTAGEHSVTPPHQVHELRTGTEACLIAYVWTGDLTGENWWWEPQDDGSWDRVCWQRQPDSSWKVTRREPLSDSEILRAGDA